MMLDVTVLHLGTLTISYALRCAPRPLAPSPVVTAKYTSFCRAPGRRSRAHRCPRPR